MVTDDLDGCVGSGEIVRIPCNCDICQLTYLISSWVRLLSLRWRTVVGGADVECRVELWATPGSVVTVLILTELERARLGATSGRGRGRAGARDDLAQACVGVDGSRDIVGRTGYDGRRAGYGAQDGGDSRRLPALVNSDPGF